MNAGPLSGLTVVELAGIAPAPFACTILADLGADVVRVDRAAPGADVLGMTRDPLLRSRRTIGVDTKTDEGVELVLTLAERADVLVEGFRPGVAERMGLGPEDVHARNPGLVYGRITGWGQTGPLAHTAGHDINYLGVSGALYPIGRVGQRPVPPVNFLADFGGGGMYLAMGVLAALYERHGSGRGQVVDASMVEGSALLTTHLFGLRESGLWKDERGENLLDGGAPFYDTYTTADGRHVAVGAIEGRFWVALTEVLGLDPEALPAHVDPREWPRLREVLAEAIGAHTRDELMAKAEGTDACLAPVLPPWEAAQHPHNVARGTFTEVDGMVQPAPGPKFDRTPAPEVRRPHAKGSDTTEVLTELGVPDEEIERLRAAGTIA